MAKRKRTGRKYFGFYQDERAVIEVIILKRRRRKGAAGPTSFHQIAAELNAEGYKTQVGKNWKAQTVKNVLNRCKVVPVSNQKKTKKTALSANDYLTENQIEFCRKILNCPVFDETEAVLFELMVNTGLRAAEVCGLQIRDLGLDKNQIDVRRGKGAKQRSVVIPDCFGRLLAWYLDKYRKNAGRKEALFFNRAGKNLTYSDLYYRVSKLSAKTGIAALHPHALRHTYAVTLSVYGCNAFFLRDQLGHSSLETTGIYGKVPLEQRRRQVGSLARGSETLNIYKRLQENTGKPVKETQTAEMTVI